MVTVVPAAEKWGESHGNTPKTHGFLWMENGKNPWIKY
jgi:hypothetical protein